MSGFSFDETEELPIPVFSAAAATSPAQQTVKVEFGAVSHLGLVRSKNQDHYAIFRLARTFDMITSNLPDLEVPERVEETGFAMMVADGMGGMAGGELRQRPGHPDRHQAGARCPEMGFEDGRARGSSAR